MTSTDIKRTLLNYYRFDQGLYVATEVNTARGIADVVAVSKDLSKVIEVEVKVSISDLKNEVTSKELKHKVLNEIFKTKENFSYFSPNYFYFALPEELIDKAVPIIEKLGNFYGIISIGDSYRTRFAGKYYSLNKRTVVKKAKRIHKNVLSQNNFKTFLQRVTSELVTLYNKETN